MYESHKITLLASSGGALSIMLVVALTFESIDEIVNCNHLKESYEEEISCVDVYKLFKLVLTFESVDEIQKCNLSNESYWRVLSSAFLECLFYHGPVVHKGRLTFNLWMDC